MPWLLDWFKTPRQKAEDCFRKGCQSLDDNDFDLAISWFNASIGHEAGHPRGFYGRGFAHLKKGNYDAAIADLSEAIRLGPDNPYSYYYRSLSYGGMGRATLEAADFERALKLGVEVDGGSSAEADFSGPSTGPSDRVVMALRAAIRETSQHDLDERIRALAAKAFSQLESRAPTQVAALLEALGNEEAGIRFGAAHGLGDLGPAARAALTPLSQALRDRDLGVRVQAARAVWRIDAQAENAVPVLIEALAAEDEVLRWIAADCLGDMGASANAAIPALEKAQDRNFQIAHVRTGIALALERIRSKQSSGQP